MSRRHEKREKRRDKQPDDWVAPSYEDRNTSKSDSRREESQPLTIEQELELARMHRHLPCADFHGKIRDDVEFEIDMLLNQNPGECVRIIYGRGTGIMEGAVMTYVRRLSGGKNPRILGFKPDIATHSIVVRVK